VEPAEVKGIYAEDEVFTEENWKSVIDGEFQVCTFVACDFSEAEFRAVRFVGCTFERCDLGLLKPTDCTFGESRFEDCRMLGIDWTLAAWPSVPLYESNAFVRSDLSMGTFTDLVLGPVRFEDCRLREVSYRNAALGESVFDGSFCEGADFLGADLTGASLRRVVGLHLDPRSTRLEGATVDAATGVSILESLGINLADDEPEGLG
jgi:uncharacterized protein YjbI with pentapeptide repeats